MSEDVTIHYMNGESEFFKRKTFYNSDRMGDLLNNENLYITFVEIVEDKERYVSIIKTDIRRIEASGNY